MVLSCCGRSIRRLGLIYRLLVPHRSFDGRGPDLGVGYARCVSEYGSVVGSHCVVPAEFVDDSRRTDERPSGDIPDDSGIGLKPVWWLRAERDDKESGFVVGESVSDTDRRVAE